MKKYVRINKNCGIYDIKPDTFIIGSAAVLLWCIFNIVYCLEEPDEVASNDSKEENPMAYSHTV